MEQLVYDNVFESIVDNKDEAADLSFRADLLSALVDLLEDRGWKQAQIAEALEIAQPRVSELIRGKVHLFSADRLIGYLGRLGVRLKPSFEHHKIVCDVEMTEAA
ncbi:helix-turn-helix domain-containing protein [Rhizobium leguminosarum]|uniref:helix-turn-helix domain-containing protein n=1 Tax=Rhizobium leguminosarum TaxID=384 RepID=UPI00102FC617|nr:helix-turn-helix transcriptional regulator [Rhizobium leguminosarum]TBG52592.1 XRE family transcriptional regulator [Rhizobium leguminosarum]